MEKVLRETKSNTFSLLMQQKEYALQVYNYLNGTEYKDPEEVEILEVESGYVLSVKSDSAILIDSALSVYEHQSTINPNIPCRLLIYVGNIFKYMLRSQDIYSSKRLTIPTPKFAVFYNGKDKFPERKTLKLSDMFAQRNEEFQLELTCDVININPGFNEDLKEKVPAIYGYEVYVEKVRGYEEVLETKEAIEKAVDECIKEGILAEFFKEYKAMIITNDAVDYTYERRLELVARDSMAEGLELGLERGLEQGLERGLAQGRKESKEKIAKSQAEIEKLKGLLEKAGIEYE